MIPDNAMGTIEKFMCDFNENEEQAIERWESLMYCKLPEDLKPFFKRPFKKEIHYDDIREMNLDEERLNAKRD